MVIPKTELRYSWIYNKQFNPDFNIKDQKKLKRDCKKFENLYNKYLLRILNLIEKYHSKEWKYTFIPIYIISNKNPINFSDPLTIRYKKNEKYMLIVLIHELLHNNSFGQRKFEDSRQLHIYMEPILNKIVKGLLPFDLSEELELFNQRTMGFYK